MQKPARKQGRNTQLGCYALAYARASAFSSEKPADEIVDTKTRACQNREERNDYSRNDKLEFLISVLIRRRELVLRKIWRGVGLHKKSSEFCVWCSKLPDLN